MTTRDRLVVLVVAVLALAGAGFFFVVKPARDDAAKLADQVTQEQARLQTAQGQVESALQAKRRYKTDYATVARLGKAIPPDDDVASLVYTLEKTADRFGVDFRAVKSAGGGSASPAATTTTTQSAAVAQASGSASGASTATGSTSGAGAGSSGSGSTAAGSVPATQAAAASAPAGSTVGTAGLPTLPFTFTFDGSYAAMRKFLGALDDLTVVKRGGIVVRGRLLTIDAVKLGASKDGFPRVEASVEATAYLVPATEGTTAGATAAGPAATATTGTATPASATPTGSTPSSGGSVAPPTAAATR
ncbi:type II secretion system protein GspM [Conexibacter sp. SYSU D00693]|uniref:type II secretion system protein GspM n=1 Tax=Conexibacter sp. SYSU D00693 TaxID=2812560 RepID=UPI00196AE8FA|nr:type II secretion system protein GspM [Conexibacter sp. SYSU D00693]